MSVTTSLRYARVTFVCALASACGSSQSGDPPPTEDVEVTFDREQFLRIDVKGSRDALEIVRTERVAVNPGAVALMPSLAGDLLAASYAGGEVRDAMFFSLPTVLFVEDFDEGGASGEAVPVELGEATLFVSAEEPLERIEIMNEAGMVLATLDAAELAASTSPAPKLRPLTTAGAPSEAMAALQASFPHIRFIDPFTDTDLEIYSTLGAHGLEELSAFSDGLAEDLRWALEQVSPAALGAIRSMAVGRFPVGSRTGGFCFGNSIVLNEDYKANRLKLEYIVAHEATHAFQNLVDVASGQERMNPDGSLLVPSAWPEDAVAAAAATVRKFRLSAGVSRAWAEIHGSAVEFGLAGDYRGDGWKDAPTDLTPEGFASRYGSRSPKEDMAEYVANLLAPDLVSAPSVCSLVRGAPSPFPPELAIGYAKIKFLEGLELADPARVAACVGGSSIRGPEGIHFGDALSFTGSLKAGWLDADGGHFLAVTGDAPPYRTLLRVLAPDNQALGMHRLDSIGLFNLSDANNALYLSHEVPERARASGGGLVLVTEVTPERVEGAIFFLSLQALLGVTDVFPISTFRVSTP